MRNPLTSTAMLCIAAGFVLCNISFAADEIPINQETVHEFTDTAMDYGHISKHGPLTRKEAETIKINVAEAVVRGTRESEDRRIFDHKASHFIRADRGIQDSAEQIRHLHECPVCVSMMRNVLRDTGIDVVELGLEFTSVVLTSPEGERLEFNLDRNGNLHRIEPVSGDTYPIPTGQLLREFDEWYVTDGWQLEGPIEQTKSPATGP